MDTNNWRPTQGTEPTMDTSDWRAQLQPDSRQRIVNKLMETLKRHLPISGHDGLHELRKIAQRLEEKIYTAATSQPDYLRKISLKMLTMETKSQNTIGNTMPSNPGGPSNNPPDPEVTVEITPQLAYEERPVAIIDRRVRKLRSKEHSSVKVIWERHGKEDVTWELEELMKEKYPYLFDQQICDLPSAPPAPFEPVD